MQVYKFGGASIATPDRLVNIVEIIKKAETPLLIIVSAKGKTTNALEEIVRYAVCNNRNKAEILLDELIQDHYQYIEELFGNETSVIETVKAKLETYITEMRWTLDDALTHAEDYIYDQIVCVGELMSTLILAEFMTFHSLQNEWLDARDIIRTNEFYRNAIVDEEFTQKQVDTILKVFLSQTKFVITQGFIGASDNNNSTTLGREGSDYTAALLGSMLSAKRVTIWKDVPGFLNADPRKFKDTVQLGEISYYEVIELAYYGAQIIHPKTIKPLQNAQIPLYVKCFLDDNLKGTIIKNKISTSSFYPPLIVHKGEQLLMKLTARDFSFITEQNLSRIYQIFAKYRVKINMLQHAAISFVAAIDMHHFAKDELIAELNQEYEVRVNENCTILTVRHYEKEEEVEKLLQDKVVLLRQISRRVCQVLYKESVSK